MAAVALPAWFTKGPRQKGPATQVWVWVSLSGWPVVTVADTGCPPTEGQDPFLTWWAWDPQPCGGAQHPLEQRISKFAPSSTASASPGYQFKMQILSPSRPANEQPPWGGAQHSENKLCAC